MTTSRARPSRPPARRPVVIDVPAPVGLLVGEPGWSGLAAFRSSRREVLELLLEAGLEEAAAGA